MTTTFATTPVAAPLARTPDRTIDRRTDRPTAELPIRRHGTVYNTFAAACDVDGDVVALQPTTNDLPVGSSPTTSTSSSRSG